MQTINYGIDAPPVIKKLFVNGLTFLIIGVLASLMMLTHHPVKIYQMIDATMPVAFIVVVALILLNWFLYWGMAFLMLCSSLRGKQSVIQQEVEQLQFHGDELVLDVGCGHGLFMISVAKKLTTGKAIGIDIWRNEDQANNSLAATLQNAQLEQVQDKVEVKHADMRELPYPDNHFDVVVSSLAIHNVENKKERERVLKEIARVLKPQGKFALLDFQHTKQYLKFFQQLGWKEAELSKRIFRMFPPVRVVRGKKG